jgi:hypothetical protein
LFRQGVLDSSQLTELVEGMGDVLAAAGNLTLRFRVAVEFADGEVAPPMSRRSWLPHLKS